MAHMMPVLVFPSANHGPLGITRTLGRLGVPVYNADFAPGGFAARSRYSRGSFLLRSEFSRPEELVRELLDVGRHLGRASILIPTSDAAALVVAEQAEALKEFFLVLGPGRELVRALCSKQEMYYLARRFHIPTPATAVPRCREDVIEFLDTATFPVILKGIDGGRLFARTGHKMFIVKNKRELLETYDTAEDPDPNLMIQEYIPGGEDSVWMFNGYFNRDSECLIGFTGRKIRQSPPYTGATSLGQCAQNETVDRTTRDFMRAIGYRGILDIGYRYDARDGQYKVLDINPRVGSTFRLFVGEHGMDVVRAMYLDLAGSRVTPDQATDGRKWLVEDWDLSSSFRYLRDGRLSLREWGNSFAGVQELAYFAADDPVPFMALVSARCRKQICSMFQRLWRCLPRSRKAAVRLPVITGGPF